MQHGVFSFCTEADNNEITKQIIYPNPANNELNINLGNVTESMIVEIYNTDGKKVIYKKISTSRGKIDISDVQSGVYFVNILKDNGEAITKKVFIK
ncbi:MAG TPA: T9SS type A sorting domain-containing protein [Bacteroidetes bacterium]|nr:T9SS type A sorting domain-containing protein [Bacteroidota bacterium]